MAVVDVCMARFLDRWISGGVYVGIGIAALASWLDLEPSFYAQRESLVSPIGMLISVMGMDRGSEEM